jgi:hypothetical protein
LYFLSRVCMELEVRPRFGLDYQLKRVNAKTIKSLGLGCDLNTVVTASDIFHQLNLRKNIAVIKVKNQTPL